MLEGFIRDKKIKQVFDDGIQMCYPTKIPGIHICGNTFVSIEQSAIEH